MSTDRLVEGLARITRVRGLSGCALVEIEAGMVWQSAGEMPGVQRIAEAASDYWRLYLRLEPQFDNLGGLRGSLMWHEKGQLVLLPCGQGMLLVGLAMQEGSVDWPSCFEQARELALVIDQL